MAKGLVRLSSCDDLLHHVSGDTFVRYNIPPDFAGPCFARGDAVVFARVGMSGSIGLACLGSIGALDGLLAEIRRDRLLTDFDLHNITVPRAAAEVLDRHFVVGPGGEWEWMWTDVEPVAVPAEDLVVDLSPDEHATSISELLALSSPRASLRPGDAIAQSWVGILDGTRIVACGGVERTGAGAAHLGSIAVHPSQRLRGYGAAITASLTRRYVDADGICTLGMYSDNHSARRLYLRLGYHDDYFWSSRTLVAVRD